MRIVSAQAWALFFASIFSVSFSFSSIRTSSIHRLDNFEDLLPVVQGGGEELVVFDIDYTLLLICDERVTPHFFSDGFNRNIAAGKSPSEAIRIQIQHFADICLSAPVLLTDGAIPAVWRTLLQKGVRFLLLTARTPIPVLVEATFRQLDDVGLADLVREDAWMQGYCFPEIGSDVQYEHGVLFVGNQDKGKALKALLDKIGYRPHHIYFVDDTRENLQAVGAMAEQTGIVYDGFHFTKGLVALANGYAVLHGELAC